MLKSYSEYPFNSILDEYPDAKALNLVTTLVEKWQRALITFYAPKPNSVKEHDAVGSGFLIKTDGVHKILTADHVLDHLQLNNCYFTLNNVRFPLTQTLVKRNSSRDCAEIMPTLEIIMHKEKFIYFTDDRRDDLEPTSSMIISGYPSSKNGLHADKPDAVQHAYNLLFNHFEYDKDTDDLYFHFDSRKKMVHPSMFEPCSVGTSLPYLNGMSGSPVLQIMKNINTGALALRAVGIFKEHHSKKEKLLVASTLSYFSAELIALNE
ncbi:hypothetical protein PUATCC27989T_04517 [Phytobacter ursingii]|nr:hypothetical protein PUATCC27989T_04517 [Phytobacter ursingii]